MKIKCKLLALTLSAFALVFADTEIVSIADGQAVANHRGGKVQQINVLSTVAAGTVTLKSESKLWGMRDVVTDLSTSNFVWTVVFIAPVNAVFHFWLARDCSFAAVRRAWPKRFYSALVAPNLISNWCVWIPVQLATFTFPVDLQIHVNGIICAFWTLMCLQIGKRSGSM